VNVERYAIVDDHNSNVQFFAKFDLEMIDSELDGYSYDILHIYEGTEKDIERWFNWCVTDDFYKNKNHPHVTFFEDIPGRHMKRSIRKIFGKHPRMQ